MPQSSRTLQRRHHKTKREPPEVTENAAKNNPPLPAPNQKHTKHIKSKQDKQQRNTYPNMSFFQTNSKKQIKTKQPTFETPKTFKPITNGQRSLLDLSANLMAPRALLQSGLKDVGCLDAGSFFFFSMGFWGIFSRVLKIFKQILVFLCLLVFGFLVWFFM